MNDEAEDRERRERLEVGGSPPGTADESRIHELENALVDITVMYYRLGDDIAAKGCDVAVLDVPLIRAMAALGCANLDDLERRESEMIRERYVTHRSGT